MTTHHLLLHPLPRHGNRTDASRQPSAKPKLGSNLRTSLASDFASGLLKGLTLGWLGLLGVAATPAYAQALQPTALPALVTPAGGLNPAWQVLGFPTLTKPLQPTALPALVTPAGNLNPVWRVVSFPKKQADIPPTRFEAASLDGQPAVRVSTNHSYGTLVQAWQGPIPGQLAWRWRLEQPLSAGQRTADLLTKAGDDAALKVCVMFDHALERVPFWENAALRLARNISGEHLPAATLCYVWESGHASGREGVNPYTRRVRFISLRGSDTPQGRWQSEQRDVAQDFARLFADELPQGAATPLTQLPAVTNVLLGADSDNTASTSLGWVADVQWVNKP